jgi:hypothetical protein
MKKILTFFACLTLFSCGKSKNDTTNQSVSGSISYKVNGQSVSMDNANLSSGEGVAFAKQLKGSVIQATRYLLNAQKGVNNILICAITTDSLYTQTYHYDSSFSNSQGTIFSVSFNGQQSEVFYSTDYFNFEISGYNNGKISGTFTAKMTPLAGPLDYTNRGAVVITEGKLNNIPVAY